MSLRALTSQRNPAGNGGVFFLAPRVRWRSGQSQWPLGHKAAFQVEFPTGGNTRLLDGIAHLGIVERAAAADRDVLTRAGPLPAAHRRGLDGQCRWRNTPTALHNGFAEMDRMVLLRRPA